MPSLLKQSIVDALNRQVIEEFTASNQYIAMALYFDSETLPQLSKYFHHQADESGIITLPDAPGLGVEIDWQALEPLRIRVGTME